MSELTFICNQCDNELEGELRVKAGAAYITVAPCDVCLASAEKDGETTGYDNGFEDGKEDGYRTAKEEGNE